jgi:hypothetical protein
MLETIFANYGSGNRAEYMAGKLPAKGCSTQRGASALREGRKRLITKEVRWQLK